MKNLKSVQSRFWKRRSWKFSQDSKGEESHEPTSSDKEMDLNLPTAQDTPDQNDEDLVCPRNSGLKFPLKGSHILLFSILPIYFDKKKKKANSTRSNEHEPRIGANKVSGFLLFWIIPYLLSYTHQKVREIVKRHQDLNRREFQWTCKKSSFDAINEAMSSRRFPAELKTTILLKYKGFIRNGTATIWVRFSEKCRKHASDFNPKALYIYIYAYSPNTGISTVFLCSALRRALLFP